MGLLDVLGGLLKDPYQANGGWAYSLLSPTASTNTPVPGNPGAPSPFSMPPSLLGDSIFGRLIRGGLNGAAGSVGYTGLAAAGAGAAAASHAATQRQLLRQQTAIGGQQFQRGAQDLAQGNLSLAQMVAQYNIWNKTLNPNAPDLTIADVQGDPGKLATLMSAIGGGGGSAPASSDGAPQMPMGTDGVRRPYADAPQLAQNVNPMAPPPASGPPAGAPTSAPSAGNAPPISPLSNLSSGFAALHNGMSPQQWSQLGYRLRAAGSSQGQAMIDEATKYDPTVIYQGEKAKDLATTQNVRVGSTIWDPIKGPLFENPQKQDVYNQDTGRTETQWVTPAMSGGTNPGAGEAPAGAAMVNPNNPGNIRPTGANTGFRNYPDIASGIVGIVNNLQAYGQKGINTVSKVISTWAPPSDNNNTQAYIADVAQKLGVDPNAPLDMSNPKILTGLSLAIANHEQGGFGAGGAQNTPASPASLPQGPSTADTEAMKGYTQTRLALENSTVPTFQAEQRVLAIADALKKVQSGTWATTKAQVIGGLKAAGIDLPKEIADDPAQVQIALKNNFQAALTQISGFSSQPAAISLTQAQANFAHPDLQPEANLAIMAQAVGTMRWQRAMVKDMQAAKLGGTQDPNAFALAWAERHPIQTYIDAANKDIGPLKGMDNAGTDATPAANGQITKTWKFDASGKLVPVQ